MFHSSCNKLGLPFLFKSFLLYLFLDMFYQWEGIVVYCWKLETKSEICPINGFKKRGIFSEDSFHTVQCLFHQGDVIKCTAGKCRSNVFNVLKRERLSTSSPKMCLTYFNIDLQSVVWCWKKVHEKHWLKRESFSWWEERKETTMLKKDLARDMACGRRTNLIYPSPYCTVIYMCLLGDNWVYK